MTRRETVAPEKSSAPLDSDASLVTVIVLNWNGERYLEACLQSIRGQNHHKLEVILVDNGSTDGSVRLVRQRFPEVRVVSLEKNHGFAAGNNQGIRHARGQIVALLNNDTEADPRWLEELARAVNSHPEIGFCASKMVLHQTPGIADSCGDSYSVDGTPGKIGHLEPVGEASEPYEVFGACAGAAIYRRSLLEDLGGFDEDFFLVYEDSDLSFRAQLKGYRCLYVPTAVVRHHLGASLGRQSSAAIYYAQRNMEYVFFKNMPAWLLVKYLPLHFLANAFRLFGFLVRGQAHVFLRAKYDALRGLRGVLRKRSGIQGSRRVPSRELDSLLTRRPVFRLLIKSLRRSSGEESRGRA